MYGSVFFCCLVDTRKSILVPCVYDVCALCTGYVECINGKEKQFEHVT